VNDDVLASLSIQKKIIGKGENNSFDEREELLDEIQQRESYGL
jgi:hypothetical protein